MYYGQFLQELYGAKDASEIEMEKPALDVDSEDGGEVNTADDWVVIEDIVEEELALLPDNPDAIKLDLRRRRKR